MKWEQIEKYPNYKVSETGQVKRVTCSHRSKKGRLLHPSLNGSGYLTLSLSNGTSKVFFIHRLVARAFLGKPREGQEVNHKDGNKLNCHIANLEYVSRRENCLKTLASPKSYSGERHHWCRIPTAVVNAMREAYAKGKSISQISRQFNIRVSTTSRVVHWKKRRYEEWTN